MKKHFWIGPPEHQNPSDLVELWLEDGDIDETKPKRSKKGEAKKEDQYLLVGFDTEFKTPDRPVTNDEIYAGMARSLILSYQFYAKTPDGFVWQGLCCPDGDERITLSEFMMFVISCGSRIHGLKSIPSKIYLVGHFTRADVPAFKYFSDINTNVSHAFFKFSPCIPIDTRIHIYCGRSWMTPSIFIRYARSSVLKPK